MARFQNLDLAKSDEFHQNSANLLTLLLAITRAWPNTITYGLGSLCSLPPSARLCVIFPIVVCLWLVTVKAICTASLQMG
jgi:hypothetical protein